MGGGGRKVCVGGGKLRDVKGAQDAREKQRGRRHRESLTRRVLELSRRRRLGLVAQDAADLGLVDGGVVEGLDVRRPV